MDGDGTDFEFNLRFPGQYFDKESSQHYNYFRDYEPGTGRYLESDPIGLEGGINSFVYVSNKPTKYRDLIGLAFDPYCAFTNNCSSDDFPLPIRIKTQCAVSCNNQFLSACNIVGRGLGTACRRYLPIVWKPFCYTGEEVATLICEEIEYIACIKRECNGCEYEFAPDPFSSGI